MIKFRHIITFIFGGLTYYCAEFIFRTIVNHRDPHWIVFFMGGFSLLAILHIEKHLKFNLIFKAIIGGAFITMCELLVGLVFNYLLKDPLWTYGGITFLKIISLKWSLLWCAVALGVMLIVRFLKWRNTQVVEESELEPQ